MPQRGLKLFAEESEVPDAPGLHVGRQDAFDAPRCIRITINQDPRAAFRHQLIIGDRQGEPWTVGVRDPRHKDGVAVLLPLIDTAVSTSGDYERFFEKDGVRYHHILDPETGNSARGSLSVTIIGPNATLTDALSTTVFVMGPEKGLKLINAIEGVDAIIITEAGHMLYSESLTPLTQTAR